MKNKIKFCIFIIETLILLVFIFIMILTRIYNNSFFSILHINDETEHLICEEIINNKDISIYEIGEPFLFEENEIIIKGTIIEHYPIHINVDNDGKPLTKNNIKIVQKQNSVSITIKAKNQKPITYNLQLND